MEGKETQSFSPLGHDEGAFASASVFDNPSQESSVLVVSESVAFDPIAALSDRLRSSSV